MQPSDTDDDLGRGLGFGLAASLGLLCGVVVALWALWSA